MAVECHITDGTGTSSSVKVSKRGELAVSRLEYSEIKFQTLDSDNVAKNFFKPIAGKRLVITDVTIDADRNIGANGATVDIFEATTDTSVTIDKQLFKFDMVKQSSKVLNGLNIITTEGKYINAKSDDSNVLLTIGGYFVET